MSLTKVTYAMIQGAPLNVLDYGADNTGSTDASAAIQAAIDAAAGNPIIVPAGTYRLDTGLVYDTTGLGQAQGLQLYGEGQYQTVFDNRTGGVAILCTSGSSLSDFQEQVNLYDFGITNSTSSANTIGIKFTGVWGATIKGVKVQDQDSHGIYLFSNSGDATSNVHVDIIQSYVIGCGGDGIICSGETDAVNAAVNISQCQVIANAGVGIVFESMQNGNVEYTAIAYNTGGAGIVLSRNATNPSAYTKNCSIKNNEFDSNETEQVYVDYATTCQLDDNAFVVNSGYNVQYQVNVSSNAINIDILNSFPRVPAGITGVSMYTLGVNATGVSILSTDWSSWSSTGNTKYNSVNSTAIIEDYNRALQNIQQTIVASDNTATNYAPPMTEGSVHRIVYTTTSARVLAAPTLASSGMPLTLIIINGSGGSLNLTFDSIYQHPTFTAPANGKANTIQYIYDPFSVKWKAIGAWSGDI